MATALVSGVAVALQPVIIKFIVDDGINRPGASADVRLSWAAVFVGVYLALSGFRIVTWRLGYKRFIASLEGILFDIRSRFFRHIQGLCFRFHD
jgi:ABC-type multidrug transport system fused ATPase/permease subunit